MTRFVFNGCGWVTPLVSLIACGVIACGGGEKNAEEPAPADPPAEEPAEQVLISQEQMDAIRQLFQRKTTVVGRCFGAGIEAGEIGEASKGFVTLGVTVVPGGRVEDVRVLESNLSSKALHQCLIEYVQGWPFPDVPKPYPTSHIYQFQEL